MLELIRFMYVHIGYNILFSLKIFRILIKASDLGAYNRSV